MVVHVDVAPELLRWAVGRAGWDEATVARRAPQLGSWLTGEKRPTLKQLEKFANATHAPFGSLFLSEPPDEPVPIPDMRTIGNAGVSRPSVDLLDTIYICQRRQDWYRDHAIDNGAERLGFVGSVTLDTPSESVADAISEMLGFGVEEREAFPSWSGAFRGLIDRTENIGVLVMVNGVVGADTHRRLDPAEFRGFALSDPLAPLIFVNGSDSKAAQLFTLVHELAHIWLGHSALSEAAMDSREGRPRSSGATAWRHRSFFRSMTSALTTEGSRPVRNSTTWPSDTGPVPWSCSNASSMPASWPGTSTPNATAVNTSGS